MQVRRLASSARRFCDQARPFAGSNRQGICPLYRALRRLPSLCAQRCPMPTVREEHPQVAHVVHFTDRLSDSDKVMLMGESLTGVYHKGASAAVAPVALSSWPIVIR